MQNNRRFPPPCSVEDVGGSFVVKASNDRPLGIHLLPGRRRPEIAREIIEPLCRATNSGRYRKLPNLVWGKR
jgi:hypothetical protein